MSDFLHCGIEWSKETVDEYKGYREHYDHLHDTPMILEALSVILQASVRNTRIEALIDAMKERAVGKG